MPSKAEMGHRVDESRVFNALISSCDLVIVTVVCSFISISHVSIVPYQVRYSSSVPTSGIH